VSAVYPPPPERKRNGGVIVAVVIVCLLALAGIVETAVLITLAMTGQI
jgi:hypothetical protein